MSSQNNIFKRISGVLINQRVTLQDIADNPTSWKILFPFLVGILSLFTWFLIQIPSALTSIIDTAGSPFPDYMIVLLFFGVIIALSMIYFLILVIVYLVGIQFRRSREKHRSIKVIFNLYIYSLSPLLILVTQIPFIFIFGGHYNLFNLNLYFFFLLGLVIGWHVTILHRSIQTNSDITPRRAKLIAILYIGIIFSVAIFIVYAILYIPFDISWLGQLM